MDSVNKTSVKQGTTQSRASRRRKSSVSQSSLTNKSDDKLEVLTTSKKTTKANREEIVERAAKKCKMSPTEVMDIALAIEDSIKEVALEGRTVCLTGFGKFYLQRHKGHPVQFAKDSVQVVDYLVYKFSASNVWNAVLRQADTTEPIEIK